MNKRWLFGLILILGLTPLCCKRLFWGEDLKLSGTLEMTEHALGSRVPGRLTRLLVDEGDLVSRGQLLATFERYRKVRKDYERVVWLYRQGGTSRQMVEDARLALEDQSVVSPVDGVVLLKVHEPGEIVAAGSAVLDIGDRKNLWVRVFVPEGKINRVQLNQPATIRLDGLKDTFKGRVSFIATKAEFTPRNVQTPEERVTQTFAVKVALEQPENYLHSGVAADVTIDLGR